MPHVTYFFNGGEELAVKGERRELAPSPRDVPTDNHQHKRLRSPCRR